MPVQIFAGEKIFRALEAFQIVRFNLIVPVAMTEKFDHLVPFQNVLPKIIKDWKVDSTSQTPNTLPRLIWLKTRIQTTIRTLLMHFPA